MRCTATFQIATGSVYGTVCHDTTFYTSFYIGGWDADSLLHREVVFRHEVRLVNVMESKQCKLAWCKAGNFAWLELESEQKLIDGGAGFELRFHSPGEKPLQSSYPKVRNSGGHLRGHVRGEAQNITWAVAKTA